ncbi:unnamed protein product [Chironomus riparius]|uniref:Uncharacterized protein n=1 Tax=Chironomus riparius TaxID=315576 RepID=A0A9N9WLI7_9DIPT|nr:unnamed protein product [Chironomus riparius]
MGSVHFKYYENYPNITLIAKIKSTKRHRPPLQEQRNNIFKLFITISSFLLTILAILNNSLTERFLNNIVDTNEPTNTAIKMHQELFEDDDDKKKRKINSQPFSISRNIKQRKYIETNNMEMNTTNSNNNKSNNESILNAMEKFNDSVTSTNRKAIEKLSREDGKDTSTSNSSQSFFQFLKSAFRCNTTSLNKIVEQTELNYPLNLHLRMNEIFSMHDKLCDIAECFNDLYSIEMVVNITGSFIMILFGIFFEIKTVSAATSYLIVLLQFDMTDDFQKLVGNNKTTTTA